MLVVFGRPAAAAAATGDENFVAFGMAVCGMVWYTVTFELCCGSCRRKFTNAGYSWAAILKTALFGRPLLRPIVFYTNPPTHAQRPSPPATDIALEGV